ncbi:hypothetical protein K438DRAFT_1704130 [Mycena galopus ATCC 62051]|nr:hypothetical protein K438DRAFT_1704130 [Mycena galopus ATCC 62051]
MASFHEVEYKKFCDEKNFLSMLPDDIAARKEAEANAAAKLAQTSLNGHLVAKSQLPQAGTYSDERFERSAVRWLIETDQASKFCNGILIVNYPLLTSFSSRSDGTSSMRLSPPLRSLIDSQRCRRRPSATLVSLMTSLRVTVRSHKPREMCRCFRSHLPL